MGTKHYRWSPYLSFIIGAVGAFLFFGILSGVISFEGSGSLQVASPEAATEK